MDPSRTVNLQLSIEQVNYEGDTAALPTYWSNRSSPQPPLNYVVDPNTEFKREKSHAPHSTSPEISFGLKDVIKELQNSSFKRGSLPDIDVSHPLYRQLQEVYTAVVSTTRVTPGDASLAQVHLHSPRRSLGRPEARPHSGDTCISSPAQVATILQEQEPKLVSELLTLISSEAKIPANSDISKMDGYRDLSQFTIDIPNSCSVDIDPQANVPTSPVLMGSKPLHKFPPGHVTVMTERGAPHPPEAASTGFSRPTNGVNRYRKVSQSSQSSVSNNHTQHPAKPSQLLPEYSYNSTSTVAEPVTWSVENQVPRYGSISNISDISLYNPERRNIPTSPVPARSPEQIAWAMRNARDRFETASNFSACSSNLDSVCSERLETMSMISDVSGYEEEMFRIKKLLLDPSAGRLRSRKSSYVQTQSNKVPQDFSLPCTVVSTNTDIAATHGQSKNIKHEDEIMAMEKLCDERVQDILRTQAHTEGKLEAARSELERFIQERSHLLEKIAELESNQPMCKERIPKLEEELQVSRDCISQLESRLRDVQTQLQQKEVEVHHWREERQGGEGELSRLRLEGEELRLELETRVASAEGLKAKVAQQHGELQAALHARLQAEAATATARADNDTLRASQLWYKDQLAKAQSARSAAQQQASTAAAELAARDALHENLRGQIAALNQQLADAERQVVREKRAMLQQLETFEADMVAREAELTHRRSGSSVEAVRSPPSETLKVSQLEASCADLQQQLESARAQLRAGEELAHQSSSEHAQLLGRTTTLRQNLAERNLQLQQASDQLTSLDAHNSRLRAEAQERDKTITDMRNQTVKLQVSLDAANREKAEVDKAIENLNVEFSQISARYQKMKRDIQNKESSLSNLQTNLIDVTTERDQFKKELNEVQLKLEGHSEFIQKQVKLVESELENYKTELALSKQYNDQYEKNIKHLKERLSESELQAETQLQQNQELAGRIAELTAGKSKAERKATKLQESLTFREEQLFTAQQGMEAAHTSSRELTEKCESLEQQSQQLQGEVSRLEEQLQRSDAVVEQYATLCRTQEEARRKVAERSYVDDASQTSPSAAKSDKTTMSDLELGTNELVSKNIKKYNDVSVQYKIETINQGTNYDNIILEENIVPLKNINVMTSNKINLSDASIQTDYIFDVEKEKLLLKVAHLEQKVSSLQSQTGQQEDCAKLRSEVTRLQVQVERGETQAREARRKYQTNVGTLLRTLKEHMRGRKWAERELETARVRLQQLDMEGPGIEKLSAEIAELQEQLRVSNERLEHLREAERSSAEALIQLERERGRLEGVSSSQESLRERVSQLEQELASSRLHLEGCQREGEAGLARAAHQLQEVQRQADASAKMVQDLHKQVLSERREISSLRQQLSSLKVGLDTANQLLESRGSELGSARAQLEQQGAATLALEGQLNATLGQLHEAQARADGLAHELQLSRDKDPYLADQLKRVSEHAQQRGAEAVACRQALQQAEQRWGEEGRALATSLAASQEEAGELRAQLEEARGQRFSLQTLAAELRGALHASMEQAKVLRTRLSSLECAPAPRSLLPDLTSSLPVPALLDETALAELLARSAAPPPPLTHLQSCLHSLQQEVNTLQSKLEQRAALSHNHTH